MNKAECSTESFSARSLGMVMLALGLALSVIGFLILPVVGLFFSLPLLVLSAVLLISPQSKACRLITETVNN